METTIRSTRTWAAALLGLALAACGSMPGSGPPLGGKVYTLEGGQEVPPVSTTAVGSANVAVHTDRTVVVKVVVSGMTPTASHIHEGAPGASGPVIVPLAKRGDNEFVSGPDAKLTEAQYAAYKAGNLYVNVHSAKHPGGEVRGQVKP